MPLEPSIPSIPSVLSILPVPSVPSIPSHPAPGCDLSPYFLAVYVDDLIIKVRKSGFGCYIASVFVACVFYADDVALLSSMGRDMQNLPTVTKMLLATTSRRLESCSLATQRAR